MVNLRRAIEREARGAHVWSAAATEIVYEHLAIVGGAITIQTPTGSDYDHRATKVSDPEAALWLMLDGLDRIPVADCSACGGAGELTPDDPPGPERMMLVSTGGGTVVGADGKPRPGIKGERLRGPCPACAPEIPGKVLDEVSAVWLRARHRRTQTLVKRGMVRWEHGPGPTIPGDKDAREILVRWAVERSGPEVSAVWQDWHEGRPWLTKRAPPSSLEEALAQWHRAHGELVTDPLAWLVVRSLGLGGEPAELTEAMVCEVGVCEACRDSERTDFDGGKTIVGPGPGRCWCASTSGVGDPDCSSCEGSGRCRTCGGEWLVTQLRPAIVRE